jgi:hypothetical protein
MEKSSFSSGGGNDVQNKPTKADSERRDEYMGQYKDHADGLSEAQKFGTDQIPVQHDAPPFKGLKSTGG